MLLPPHMLEVSFCVSNKYYVQVQKLMATGSYLLFFQEKNTSIVLTVTDL